MLVKSVIVYFLADQADVQSSAPDDVLEGANTRI